MTRLLQLVLIIGFLFIAKPTCAVSAIINPTHLHVSAPASQPTQAQIDAAASEAQSQGRVINITPGGMTIPAALQEVASLPVTFRSTIGNWNYDITVLSMGFTPTGSVLSMGCRFYLPGSTTSTSLYFGANDIAVSGKSGFSGDLPILESLLSDAKSNELDDPAGKLGGQTKFVEFPVPAFHGKAWMGLGKDTKLSFSCGEFKKFSLSGFLKVYDLVEREDPAGQSLTDGKPLLFFWGTKDVFDWQDMYFPVTASRGFHSANADDIGFHPTDKTNAILDLSNYQSPANLPDCGGGSLGDSWQGIQFDAFAIRLPKLFKLRNPHTLMGQGTNLFLSPNGVIGTVTADKVFTLEEGYTDEINKFDLSLDQVTANFSCGASASISMSGRFRLGMCGTGAEKAKELYYNVVYTEQDRRYQVLIKESATDRFKNNGLTLSTGSTLSVSIQNESFVFQTALPARPRLSTPAYNNSICLNYPTTLTVNNCESISSKWSTGEVDKGTVTINPKATTTYKINCFDKYCINEDSDDLTITVYESLPQPRLTATSLAFCTYQNASLRADQCVGKLEWQTPDNTTFRELSSNQQTAYFPGQAATTTFAYTVRCNLNTCLSPEKPLSLTVYPEPKAPSLWSSATNNTIDRNNDVTISGSCPDNNSIVWDNLPQARVKLASSATYSAYCKNPETGCQTQSRSSIGINVLYFPPAAPSPVTFGSVGTNYITVNWRDNSDNEDGFWVDRDTSPAFSNSIRVGDVGANTTSFIDYNLTEGATYYYRIISHNRYDYGYSEIASRATGVTPDKPILTASSTNIERGSNSNVSGYCRTGTLVWTAPANFSGGSLQQSDKVTYSAKCLSDGIASGESYVTVNVYDKPVVVEPPQPPTCTPPTLSLNGSSANVTRGSSIYVTANCSSGSVSWTSPANFGGGWVQISDNTTFKAKCKVNETCESGETSQDVTVTGTPPVVEPPQPPTCTPPTLSLNGSSANVTRGSSIYVTANCSSGSVSWTSPANFGGGWVQISDNTTFKAKCKVNETCESGETSQDVTVTGTPPVVEPPQPPTCTPPTLSLNGSSANVTRGSSIYVTASCSSGSVSWTSPANFGGGWVQISDNTTFKAKCKVNETCESGETSQDVTVTGTPPVVEPPQPPTCTPPTLSLNGSSANVTRGSSIYVTANCSSGSVSWTSPANFGGGWVQISDNTTFKAKCKVNETCESGETSQDVTVTGTPPVVEPPQPPTCTPPTLSLNGSSANVTRGSSIYVTANCSSGSVSWTSPANFGGGWVQISDNTTFKAKCKVNETCESGETSQDVTVTGGGCAPSKPTLSANSTSINNGESVKLTANSCSAGVSLDWENEDNSQVERTVTPDQTTTYRVRCWQSNTCYSEWAEVTITVTVNSPCNNPPTPIIKPDKTFVEEGTSIILTASGCSYSVSWYKDHSPTSYAGSPVTISTGTGYYTAKCVNGTCSSDESNEVRLTFQPKLVVTPNTPSISATKTTICPTKGEFSVLKVDNCNGTLSWSTGESSNSITVYEAKTYTASCATVGHSAVSTDQKVGSASPSIPSIDPVGTILTAYPSGCTTGISWYRWGDGYTGNKVKDGSNIDITQFGLGQYEARCTNDCGTASTFYTARGY